MSTDSIDYDVLYGWNQKKTVVYFLRAGNMFKIGITTNIKDRLEAIRSCSPVPVDLVLFTPGNLTYEKHIHEIYDDLRSHNEWFEDDGRIQGFCNIELELRESRGHE